MISFPLDENGGYLVFSQQVLDHFVRHQQRHWRKAEAGGQLFARLTPYEIFVEEATGPRPTDIRTRTTYMPDRELERKEIQERFSVGLHYVGDWHTHPEQLPSPSSVDRATISDCSRRSTHKLEGFLLAIVGKGHLPECLSVSFYPGRALARNRAIVWKTLVPEY